VSTRPPPPQPPPAAEPEETRRLRAERAAAVEAMRAAVRDTTRLMRLFAILNEPAAPAEMFDRVLATLSELFMADVVALLESAGDDGLRPLAAIGLPLNQVTWPTAAGGGYAAEVLRGGTVGTTSRARADPRVEPCLVDVEAETAVWLPVAGDGPDRRGVLVLARCRPVPFSRSDVNLLQAMSYRIGRMIDRAHDEQERRKLDLQLQRAEKAESLGRMAGAVAHHFNNMLAAVIGSLELALQDLPADHRCRPDVARAEEAARRAAEISGLLLDYLGQAPASRSPTEIGQLVAATARRAEAGLPRHVRLAVKVDPAPMIALANAAQIAQAVINLVKNAAESIDPPAGEVRVSAHLVPAAAVPRGGPPSGDWQPRAPDYVCVEIVDNGCGIRPEAADKIFDPFFSSKAVGRGLGLPVVLGIVRAHDGTISVQSSVQSGTKVRLFLPRIDAPAPAAPAGAVPAVGHVARGVKVLLADDEDIVRRTAELMLAKLGYEVVTAADGFDAVERFRPARDDVGFVVLDLTMPRMNGWDALAAVRALRPGIPAILTSGYDEARALGSHPADTSPVFLHKPFTFDELKAAIAKLD